MSNRKLIRPSLAELKDQVVTRPPRKKPSPHGQTNAENFYYLKQIQNGTPMVMVLQDGEQIRGTIDWYDRNSIRIKRQSDPHVMVLKHFIKYMYKENEDKEKDSESEYGVSLT
jgi:host factor-I protein